MDGALLEVGHVVKPHGLRGDVVVALVSDRVSRLDAGNVLETDRGPLTIEWSRPHQHRWVVHFAGYTDRSEVEQQLVGLALRAAPLDEPDTLWVHDLVGTVVRESGGVERGRVVAVVDNPAHELLELDSGALVPVVFVTSCQDGITTIEPPEGLFDPA